MTFANFAVKFLRALTRKDRQGRTDFSARRSPARREATFVVVWEFHIHPKKRRAFERIYDRDGEWAQFFRIGKGYIRTELLRDPDIPNRYLTLDYWSSLEHYERFKMKNRATYELMDKKCEALTMKESEIGRFTCFP